MLHGPFMRELSPREQKAQPREGSTRTRKAIIMFALGIAFACGAVACFALAVAQRSAGAIVGGVFWSGLSGVLLILGVR